jgi:hypothetical protein
MSASEKIIKTACFLMLLCTASCASQSLPDLTKEGSYSGLYSEISKKTDTKLVIEQKRLPLSELQYIRVWRGSYKDNKGNLIEDGWEWLLLREGGPDANF